MNILELGAIGELVGGVAVVVTLIYLALQVRHTSETSRFTANATLHANLNDLSPQFFNAENAAVLQSGLVSFSKLSPEQQAYVNVFFYMVFSHGELVLLPSRRKRVDEDLVHRTNVVMAFYLGSPGVREWWYGEAEWPPMREGFSEEFRAYIEALPQHEGFVGRTATTSPWSGPSIEGHVEA